MPVAALLPCDLQPLPLNRQTKGALIYTERGEEGSPGAGGSPHRDTWNFKGKHR